MQATVSTLGLKPNFLCSGHLESKSFQWIHHYRWRCPKILVSSLLLIAYFVVYLHQMFLTREYTFSRLITLQKRCHVHRHLCTKIEKTHQTRTKNRTTKNTMIAFSWFCFYKMFCTIDNYYPKSKVICKKSTLFWLCSEKFFKERKFFFRTRGSGRQS